jgi:hypothetical protein
MVYATREDGILVSDDRALLDFTAIHGFLSTCYWSGGISMEQVQRQTRCSTLVFGLYRELPADSAGPQATLDPLAAPPPAARLEQLGFARVLSDLTRFAYLCDVFIVTPEQGQGLGKRLLRDIKAHPELVDVRRWLLATRDAHGLYAQFGFEPLRKPEVWMSIHPNKEVPGRWV